MTCSSVPPMPESLFHAAVLAAGGVPAAGRDLGGDQVLAVVEAGQRGRGGGGRCRRRTLGRRRSGGGLLDGRGCRFGFVVRRGRVVASAADEHTGDDPDHEHAADSERDHARLIGRRAVPSMSASKPPGERGTQRGGQGVGLRRSVRVVCM